MLLKYIYTHIRTVLDLSLINKDIFTFSTLKTAYMSQSGSTC